MPRAKKDEDGLTPLQRKFVMKILADPAMRGGAAARAAGYSEKTADRQAHDLLKLAPVRRAIEKVMLERQKRLGLDADAVLRELMILSFSSPDNYEIIDGDICPADGVDPAVIRAVSSVTQGKDGETKFTLYDKKEPLKMLSAHLNICTPKTDVTVKGSLYDLICGVEEEEEDE